VRAAALALACAVLGGAAALGIGRATGLVGESSTETVVVRETAPARFAATAARAVPLPGTSSFAPARIFARRSPGVVTVYSYFAGTAAQGSGFVVSRAGTILTNAHVITNAGERAGPVHAAESVFVEFADRDRIPARVVGWDVFDDVGVLRVSPASHALVPVPLGRSSDAVVGEPVVAIGSPLGNADSLAVGIVSGVHRSISALTAPSFSLLDAIQTDAPIAHGSSGGPLLDAGGRAIGINAQLRSDPGGSAAVGFAVPIDSARRSLHELLTKGHVRYAYAGIQSEDVTPSLSAELKLRVRRGALVDRVTPGGPAAAAGLRGGRGEREFEGETIHVGGDVIVAVDGLKVTSADSLVRIVTNRLRPGQTALFSIVRSGRRQTVAVKLVRRPG
jgi:S1-C subfamily serine protease